MSALDPRWDWVEIRTLGDATPQYVKAGCNHLPEHVVPVESGGEIVATLCLTCDAQLPAEHATAHVVPVTRFP